MTTTLRTSARTAMAAGIISDAGSGAKMKLYDGTRPSGVSAIGGGNNLLATITFGSVIGTATSGTIDWDEAGTSQSNGSHADGTPTFVDITTSADAIVGRLDLGGGEWTFTGTVQNGVDVDLTSLVWTMPHA
jgi:hypothetical protein